MSGRPIRIAIVGTRGIPARYGGFETFAHELSERLSRVPGFEVTVVCPKGTNPGAPDRFGAVRLEYVPELPLGPLTSIVYDVRSVCKTMRTHDIVYILGVGASFAGVLPRLLGKQVWVNPDGLEWKREKWSYLGRTYLKLMERVATRVGTLLVADAAAIEEYLRATYGPDIHTAFIPYGAILPDRSRIPSELLPFDLTPDSYNLLVARLEPENRILEIVRGYEKAATELPLIVVGNIDREREYVRKVLAHAGPRIRFVGGVYDKTVLACLRLHCAHAFHGHTVGGTNPSLLEALACGNLVVAHDNEFNREVGGSLMRYFGADEDISMALLAFQSMSPEQRQSIKSAAVERVRSAYNWEGVASAYVELAVRLTGTMDVADVPQQSGMPRAN